MAETEVKVKKNNWFKHFMIFLLVIVVAVSLGLIIFYFTQNKEEITKNQSRVQVNATESFTVEITQKTQIAKEPTAIEVSFDANALQLKETRPITKNKEKKTIYEFVAQAADGSYVSGEYQIVFTPKDTSQKPLTVDVVIADGEDYAFFISNSKDLASIGKEGTIYDVGKNYELTQDVDLASIDHWTPIEGFRGTFNGNGHTIKNLTINTESVDNTNVGFFADLAVTAKVVNVKFEDAKLISTEKAGNFGIVAGKSSGTIERVQISESKNGSSYVLVGALEDVAQTNDIDEDGEEEQTAPESEYKLNSPVNVGAVVGLAKRTQSTGVVLVDRVAVMQGVEVSVITDSTSDSFVGGIVGLVESATIINSYSRNDIYTDGEHIYSGGIAGKVATVLVGDDFKATVTTAKKGNIITSYTTAVLSKSEKQKQTTGLQGAVVAINENLGVLDTIVDNTRTYVTAYDDITNSSVRTAIDELAGSSVISKDNLGSEVTNKTLGVRFSGDSDTNVLYENRYVGVYYQYIDSSSLVWTSKVTGTANLDVTETYGTTSYMLVKGVPTLSGETLKSYNFLKEEINWDFDNIWENVRNGDGYPILRNTEYATALDIYDPQSAFDGYINNIAQLKALNGKEGNFTISEDLIINNDTNWTPIELKGNIFGNGHTITVQDCPNFTGLFKSVAANVVVEDLTIKASVNNVNNENAKLSDDNGFGLVTNLNNGTIRNVTVTASSITVTKANTTTPFIGAVAGNNKGTIENVKVENTTITLKEFDNSKSVGFIAGTSSGTITKSESVKTNVLNATDSTGTLYVGLIAGAMTNSALVNQVKAAGTVTLVTGANGKNYVGGIVGNSLNQAKITNSLVENADIQGNIVGGVSGFNKNTATDSDKSVDAIEIVQVNSTVTLKGNNVGGIVGHLSRGFVRNVATYATLKTTTQTATVSGYAYKVDGEGDIDSGSYAGIYYVFASTTLDISNGGTAYNETTSEVRTHSSGWMGEYGHLGSDFSDPNFDKIAGFVRNSYYNNTLMQGTRIKNTGNMPLFVSVDYVDGALTAEQCTDKANFKDWNTTEVWLFANDEQGNAQMPVLQAIVSDDFTKIFNGETQPVVEPTEPEENEGE